MKNIKAIVLYIVSALLAAIMLCGCGISEMIDQIYSDKKDTDAKKEERLEVESKETNSINIDGFLGIFGTDVADGEVSDSDRSESLPPIDESEYDSVLAMGDGYYLVDSFSETYASASTSYGVVNESGEWVCSLSSTNGFATAVEKLMSDGYNQAYSTPEYAYLGDGIFVVKVRCVIVGKEYVPSGYWNDWGFHGGCYLVNVSGKICNGGGFMITEIYDGYAFTMHTNGRIDRLDMSGNSQEFGWRTSGKAEYIGIPSCGLVCCGNVFYDIKTGDEVIDLTEYNLVEDDCRYFEKDGTYTFEFYNPAGTRYRATIDTTGEFIDDPQKIS